MPPSSNKMPLVRESLLARSLAVILCLAFCAPVARAHPAISASAILRIESNRRVTMLLSFDALAFTLDETPRNVSDAEMYKLLDGPDADLTKKLAESRDRFAALFEVLADGRRVDVEMIEFPTLA